MATSRKKQNDDFLFATDEKASRRKRVAAPTTPVAGPSGPAMSGGPSGPAMSGGPSGPAMSGGAKRGSSAAAPAAKRRRRSSDDAEMRALYG